MIEINELRRLTQAVVKGWGNCDQAWLDQSEDTPAAVVGHIDEDGETYPVATIDCDQYYAAHQSLPLARFYAAANPAAVSELLDRLEAVEKERDALRAKVASSNEAWKSADRACHDLTEKVIPNLREQVEAAEKERDWHAERCEDAMNECAALRAKIAETERQEPVYLFRRKGLDDFCTCSKERYEELSAKPRLFEVKTLYALPGAKGEEK